MTSGRSSIGLVALGAALSACSRDPDDLREWRPTDHKHQSESGENGSRAPQVSGSSEAPMPGLEEVTIAAWRRSCSNCHGQLGRGDGPQGPMVKARDLSDPAWQTSATDAQIADSILKGRGQMPAFTLPASTVEGLVRLVRLLNRTRLEASQQARPGASAVPSPSAPPAPSGGPRASSSAAIR